ncbi:hypothetical protein [Candidatus Enterococcus mansonii]|uniref:Uncharacterized protein n=1 Tax=Candidatus Enterococcus mansonii TaxID=1834181 RepID=A0A2C9XHR7_9ENTE|nr:hypothetical protein [Enterococcus sp. 4G2_DIV0659]OTO02777.1 hypothetical protein A5880_003173 [Enterococcus sp. 4G2_DIV0659]
MLYKKIGTLTVLTMILLVISGLVAYMYLSEFSENDSKKIEKLQKENKQLKKKESEVAELTDQLSQQVDTLYTEKNGTANDDLTTAAKELFSTVFDYCTEREEDNVKARKDKALELGTKKAVDGLFPKDAASSNPSVKTTSHLKGDPEVYLMPSNDKQLTALVVVHYAVSIAGSEDQPGTFMYKVKFDSTENQFTSVENAGVINIQ